MIFDGFKVFSATKYADREALGDRVTEWLKVNKIEISEVWVRQSSDSEFHCLSIILAYRRV
jgi:hypothetical protein